MDKNHYKLLNTLLYFLIAMLFTLPNVLLSQETITITPSEIDKDKLKEDSREINDMYLGIKLGTTRNEVISLVDKHPLLEKDEETYYGDFDAEQKYIIRAKKPPIIDHIYLQFIPKENINYTNFKELEKDENWKLYMIIIHFNPKYNNFNSLCEKVRFKYGMPNVRTPYKAVWKQGNNKIKLIIDNPSTVKIVNAEDFLIASKKYKRYKRLTAKDFKKDIFNAKFLKDFE